MSIAITLDMIRLIQRLAMLVTVACCLYVLFFLFGKGKDSSASNGGRTSGVPGGEMITPAVPVFNARPHGASDSTRIRDLFSTAPIDNRSGQAANTPAGQLPGYLKIVGIVVAHPSQIIIEDTSANKTYFVDEGTEQDGVKIVRVSNDRMTISYLGQEIPVGIHRE